MCTCFFFCNAEIQLSVGGELSSIQELFLNHVIEGVNTIQPSHFVFHVLSLASVPPCTMDFKICGVV